MDFVEILFPKDISYGATGGPEFYTNIATTASGREYRNINWAESRNKYNVAHGIKTYEQMQTLLAFFYARRGRAVGFRFCDWADYKAEMQLIGIGNGTSVTQQLSKIYDSGSIRYVRKISKPVTDTVKIFLNDQPLPDTSFEVNITNGTISFTTPPVKGTEIKASFYFDVPVRFDNDRLISSIDEHGNYNWRDINLVEVRL